MPPGLVAVAFSADGSENAPLTRWPGAFELGSATLSAASPADEMTLAVVDAVYVFATPGVNGPKRRRRAERQASVCGTEPPTGVVPSTP